MKAKLGATLFALPFASIGVWMLWSIGITLYDAWRMQDWVPVNAQISAGGYATNSGDDSDTYRAYATYSYTFGGQQFSGNRVALNSSGDNIGGFQREAGRKLSQAAGSGATIVVYVAAEDPAQSIIYRDIRWGLIGFKLIFVVVFGGIGFVLLIAVWRAAPEKDVSETEYQGSPWLLNENWQTAAIRSSSKKAMWGAWGFAVLWNAISIALPFLIYDEVVEKSNYLALIGLLFPLVGLGLVVWAIRRTREWTRFGPAPVTLDPFPGSIGGHVGGTIDLKLPYNSATEFQLTLTSIHSYERGSGEDSRRREDAKWQDTRLAHAETGNKGTRLRFRFEVPAGLEPSDIKSSDSYYLWRLSLHAGLPGTDLDRSYEIPVFPTATPSRVLSDRAVQEARTRQEAVDEELIRKRFELRVGGGDKRLLYPVRHNFVKAVGGFIIGSSFATGGFFLVTAAGERLMGGAFLGVGGLIAIACGYLMFSSLEVIKDMNGITSVRRWLGIPFRRRQTLVRDIVSLAKTSNFQSQSGGRHVMHYTIHALDRSGRKIVVGEGFRGESQARAAMRFIEREFGLRLA